jgi:hypothetical protein
MASRHSRASRVSLQCYSQFIFIEEFSVIESHGEIIEFGPYKKGRFAFYWDMELGLDAAGVKAFNMPIDPYLDLFEKDREHVFIGRTFTGNEFADREVLISIPRLRAFSWQRTGLNENGQSIGTIRAIALTRPILDTINYFG